MFRGVSHIAMDAKSRLAMPAKHRERLMDVCGGQLVATIDTHARCLLVYPMPDWEEIEKKLQALPTFNPKVRSYQRLLLGYASDLELDGSGRFLLPPSLREHAQLDRKAVLVGQVNKFELWSEELWIAERDRSLAAVAADDTVPEEMMSLTL